MKLIPKYQQGYGIVPVGYTALPWTTTAAGAASEAAPQAAKAKEDNLFSDTIINSLKSKALTSDMQYFLSQSSLFKDDIFSGMFDASTTEQRTKELLLYATRMENEKEEYNHATERIRNIKAQDEIALTPDGQVFVYNKGKVEVKRYANITNKDMLLTNAQLANYRANDVTFAFNNNVTSTLSNATSFKEIRDVIDDAVKNLGQQGQDERNIYGTKRGGSEDFIAALQQMGITQKELRQIPADKLIEIKVKGMNNAQQIEHAFNAVLSQLTPTQQRLLGIRAKQLGIKDPSNLVLEYINARSKGSISYSLDIMNLKDGTKGSNRTSSGDDIDKLKLTPGAQLAYEFGTKETFTLNKGTRAQVQAVATRGLLLDDQKGTGLGIRITESPILNMLKTESMTMGGERVNREGLNRVYLKDPRAAAVNLPIDLAKLHQEGIIAPDFELAQKVQDVMKEVNRKGIKDPEKINQMLKDAKLAAMYVGGTPENPIINSTNYAKFIVLDAIVDEKAFNDGAELDKNPLLRHSTDQEIEVLTSNMKKYDKDLEPSSSIWGDQPIYTGSLFIPFDDNVLNSYIGSGKDITIGQAHEVEALDRDFNAEANSSYRNVNKYTNEQ